MQRPITVIIPVYNAPEDINRCVRSIFRGRVRPEEILLVDDCSTDSTMETLRGLESEFPSVRVIESPRNGGPTQARNIGAREARCELLFFVDCDTLFLDNTLEVFFREIQHSDAVTGHYHYRPLKEGWVENYKALQIHYLRRIAGKQRFDVFAAACAGIKKSVFWDVGGFNEKLRWGMDCETEEFGARINQKYENIVEPELMVRHDFPGFKKLTQTYFSRVALWMEIFVKRRKFESSGATPSTGMAMLSMLAAVGLALLTPLHWVFGVLAVGAYGVFTLKFLGFYGFVAKVDPRHLFSTFLLNHYFSFVIASGACYGVLKRFMGTSRIDQLMDTSV